MLDPQALQPVPVTFPACGVFVLESRHGHGFRMPPTRAGYLKVILVSSGAGFVVRRTSRVSLRARDVVLVPPEETHHIEDAGQQPLSLYALCVAEAPPTVASGFRHFAHPAWSGELRELVRHLLHEQTLRRAGHDLMLRGLALQALGLLTRAHTASSAAVVPSARDGALAHARVAAYAREMERTFFHPETIDIAARKLGLSRRRFTQLFREVAGETWLRRVHRHRLAHARRLLEQTNRSVASIGYESGFDDLTTFYRAFKSAEGTSPLAWRERRQAPRRPQRAKIASSTPN